MSNAGVTIWGDTGKIYSSLIVQEPWVGIAVINDRHSEVDFLLSYLFRSEDMTRNHSHVLKGKVKVTETRKPRQQLKNWIHNKILV